MGKFLCGSHIAVEFDDRVLAHIQVVIGAKLRRGESMLFSWRDSPDAGDGRTTVWIHPLSDVVFKYYGHRKPAVNPEWVDAMMLEANKPGGLQLIEEPGQNAPRPVAHHNPIAASGFSAS
ncbi:ATP-dependent DNA ligase [Cnuibacter physcomitrellae]|uniref:ATP-dependent DNA ligase n=1 Tax=Cnuibacter physcomitrellae TaxID=1619308 RepID=A0A1X9LH78_9MICO|nr:ATP-dependent DNA ligase [Cnuibacter physcomitrellae]ARJ03872.1 ATP-dependent DNA ligase [Cnuibacter physcomitrellae]